MTTLVLTLPLGLAKSLARAADLLEMTHDETAREAIRLFCRLLVQRTPQRHPRKRTP